MRRARIDVGRALLALTVLAFLTGAATAGAQDARPRKPARIGRLSPLSAEADAPNLAALRQGLRELGWVEGQDFAIEGRFAAGRPDRLGALATDLVRRQVDVIVVGSTPGALAASQATSAIPIVVVTTGDPIEGGLVASLAHPGRNLTGVTALGQALSA